MITRFLFGVDRSNRDVIFAYEQNGSERLDDYVEADGIVLVRSYRNSDPGSPPEVFLTALEAGSDRVLWRRANDGIFMDGNKDFVVTACCDPFDIDRPTQLEAFAVRSGASFLPQAIDGFPEQIAVRDNLVYVNLGSKEQAYELSDRD